MEIERGSEEAVALAAASTEIEKFVAQTKAIARQTHMLALNAGIAAQVGEFEVRERAAQTLVQQLTEQLEHLRAERETANAVLTEAKVTLAEGDVFGESMLLAGEIRCQRHHHR